jgi:hypothetical protein
VHDQVVGGAGLESTLGAAAAEHERTGLCRGAWVGGSCARQERQEPE